MENETLFTKEFFNDLRASILLIVVGVLAIFIWHTYTVLIVTGVISVLFMSAGFVKDQYDRKVARAARATELAAQNNAMPEQELA